MLLDDIPLTESEEPNINLNVSVCQPVNMRKKLLKDIATVTTTASQTHNPTTTTSTTCKPADPIITTTMKAELHASTETRTRQHHFLPHPLCPLHVPDPAVPADLNPELLPQQVMLLSR